jgi:hypothetical protein
VAKNEQKMNNNIENLLSKWYNANRKGVIFDVSEQKQHSI